MMRKLFIAVMIGLFMFSGVALAADKSLTFTWQHVIPDDMSHYSLYEYDNANNPTGEIYNIDYVVDMSLEYAAVITVPDGVSTTLCYDISASDLSGNESGKSNNVCVDIDFAPPVDPTDLSVTINIVPVP